MWSPRSAFADPRGWRAGSDPVVAGHRCRSGHEPQAGGALDPASPHRSRAPRPSCPEASAVLRDQGPRGQDSRDARDVHLSDEPVDEESVRRCASLARGDRPGSIARMASLRRPSPSDPACWSRFACLCAPSRSASVGNRVGGRPHGRPHGRRRRWRLPHRSPHRMRGLRGLEGPQGQGPRSHGVGCHACDARSWKHLLL
jgi:hypothetical protein